jgi:hypothetical protein
LFAVGVGDDAGDAEVFVEYEGVRGKALIRARKRKE